MKLKEIKCPSCNANISLKENATKGVCEYCKTEFIIDDDTIKVEHTGTIEITNDTSLKVAETTLNKFKDYDKSLLLYKGLLFKYAHKKEVYIGLVRSISKDFKETNINGNQLAELNNYWHKYTTLATDKEIVKYEEKIKEINKNYWYTKLIDITENFNIDNTKEKVDIIESCYNNYLKYCNKNEKIILDNNYKPYITNYKKIINENTRKKKTITKIILGIIIITLLGIIIFLLTETPKKNTDSIKLSDINEHYYVESNDYNYFKKYLKETYSDIKITEIKLNTEDKTLDVNVLIKNILKEKEHLIKYEVIDDSGPVITQKNCSFTDTEEINLYSCFSLYDFTDGKINENEAIIKSEGIDFKTEGNKTITVTAKDKDGNENSQDILVIITKTPIELKLSLEDTLIVNNYHNINYSITPNNVSNTSVSYSYDKNYITIENNKIKALKKGNTEICAISNYDSNIKNCKNVTLELQCQDKYIFNFDGSKKETVTANETFCPGTYKIYANVLNKNEFYHIDIKPKNEFHGESLTIFKNSAHLNEEGSTYVLTDGYTITTEIGITQITLIKQK